MCHHKFLGLGLRMMTLGAITVPTVWLGDPPKEHGEWQATPRDRDTIGIWDLHMLHLTPVTQRHLAHKNTWPLWPIMVIRRGSSSRLCEHIWSCTQPRNKSIWLWPWRLWSILQLLHYLDHSSTGNCKGTCTPPPSSGDTAGFRKFLDE